MRKRKEEEKKKKKGEGTRGEKCDGREREEEKK